ncbi:GH1 family beta-glucosidase [Thermomonospora cellulosilytica]|uniref:Beta-glucosidase n=1 Tax=Thermomonospora cellulosilytica TaxID=1411118 RepID=A0A7W3MTG9_9ACTN|nr:GH1 family beta-glucosidase [Thermomonospora cellulosilytica]MBA9001600.1 beta-glucosidase [Thermomonospora cellulosilytica]
MTTVGSTTTARTASQAFPAGFVWGAATAAYQIEGAAHEDGRGPSIWDTFARRPGAVAGGDTGDVACDHYHRWREDIALMASLGLGAYRFSVSWPRVQPDGSGPVNPRGLDFYDRLVDGLLEAGITPYVTLYHWDLPQALEDAGGWTVRDTAYRFAEYAGVVHDRLADRADTWTTINEPWVASFLGYGAGVHAPGRTSADDAFRAAHHLMLAHGLAARRLREAGAERISLTLNLAPVLCPADAPGEADLAAVELVDSLLNRQFLDAALRGSYPDAVLERARRLGHVRDGDLAVIAQPIDSLGINYYNPTYVRAAPGAPENPAFPGSAGVAFPSVDLPTTAMGWPIAPDGLTELLLRLHRDHPGVPLVVTENGAAFDDVPGPDGRVADPARIGYLEGHLRAAHAALAAGVDLRGYLVWSLLDNFEWAEGYGKRFGIVYVDYADQRRLPKDSARWYAGVIARNGLEAP